MVKILVCGSPEFVERINREAEIQQAVRIVAIATDVPMAVDLLERSGDCCAVLLGFSDGQNEALIGASSRYGVKIVPFVSVPDLMKGYRRWAALNAQAVQAGGEIGALIDYFSQYPADAVRTGHSSLDDDEIAARVASVRAKARPGIIGVPRKVCSFFSFKGGVGKTVCTVATGCSIAALTDLSVCIVDLDTSRDCGDVVKYMGFMGPDRGRIETTLVSWTDFPYEKRADREVVESRLIKCRKKLFVLPAVRYMAETVNLTPGLITRAAEVLRRHFDVILFDLGNFLTDPAITAMEMSDEIFLVNTLDVTEVYSLKGFVANVMPHIRVQRSQVNLVFNRIIAGQQFSVSDAAAYVGVPCVAAIPEDMELRRMIANKGTVPFLGGQDLAFTRELEKIMLRILPREVIGGNDSRRSVRGGVLGLLKIFSGAGTA